jgi:hypothetical protein
MGWLIGELSAEARALLERGRAIPAVPAATRARAMERARQALSSSVPALLATSHARRALPAWRFVGLVCLMGALTAIAATVLGTHAGRGTHGLPPDGVAGPRAAR